MSLIGAVALLIISVFAMLFSDSNSIILLLVGSIILFSMANFENIIMGGE